MEISSPDKSSGIFFEFISDCRNYLKSSFVEVIDQLSYTTYDEVTLLNSTHTIEVNWQRID